MLRGIASFFFTSHLIIVHGIIPSTLFGDKF